MTTYLYRTVLITGVGSPGAPGIIKSLRLIPRIRIVGVDARSDAVGSMMVDKFITIPRANSPKYLPTLLRIAKKERVDVLLPLNTAELTTLSENKDRFSRRGTVVSISDPVGLAIANDKLRLLGAMEGLIPIPKYILVSDYSAFERAVKKLGYPEKDVCFKPPVSNGMRGFRILSDKTDQLDILFNKKPDNTITRLEDIRSILKKARPFPDLIVMEFLLGKEYSVDVLADYGRVLQVIPRSRDLIKQGITFNGTIVQDRQLIAYSKIIIGHLGLHGNIGFQFIKDATGVPRLIESNPRLQGTTVFCTYAGANLVHGAVQIALGKKYRVKKVHWGLRMLRYWEEKYL